MNFFQQHKLVANAIYEWRGSSTAAVSSPLITACLGTVSGHAIASLTLYGPYSFFFCLIGATLIEIFFLDDPFLK